MPPCLTGRRPGVDPEDAAGIIYLILGTPRDPQEEPETLLDREETGLPQSAATETRSWITEENGWMDDSWMNGWTLDRWLDEWMMDG